MSANPPGQPATPSSNAVARPSVVQLAIKEKAALYAAYIPLFKEGGVFIPTSREYQLGADVYVLMTLPDDTQRGTETAAARRREADRQIAALAGPCLIRRAKIVIVCTAKVARSVLI